jgi:lysophospholipase L1-like esterase
MPARRRSRTPSLLALIATAAILAGCTAPDRSPDQHRGPVVYVALGASDTVGIGSSDPPSDAWPVVFARTALPANAEVHNLGIAGATTADALRRELPPALALRPTNATVWLNVNDLTHGVPVDAYQRHLRELLTRLRRGGRTRVLVATTPQLQSLPAYLECRRSPSSCGIGSFVPPPSFVELAVDAYNDAISTAARQAGAIVVDLHAFGNVPVEHPGWVSADGFHPNTVGYRHVAAAFADALRSTS